MREASMEHEYPMGHHERAGREQTAAQSIHRTSTDRKDYDLIAGDGERASLDHGREECEARFTIPLAFPSVNSLHQIIYSQRRVELKPEIRKWKNDAGEYVPRIILRSQSSLIRIDVVFHYPFYYANGKLREFDTHNAVKPLLDLIAAKAGFNDKRVKSGSWDSADSKDEKVEVVLRELPLLLAQLAKER
jgi:hypothetical protein